MKTFSGFTVVFSGGYVRQRERENIEIRIVLTDPLVFMQRKLFYFPTKHGNIFCHHARGICVCVCGFC